MSEEQVVRSTRPLSTAWIGGVCAGLADHLGWPVLLVRLGFVVVSAFALTGLWAYLVLWLAMPRTAAERSAPGLEANARAGMRSTSAVSFSGVDLSLATALALLGIGLTWMVQVSGWGLPPRVLAVGLLTGGGLGMIWWQADHVSTREVVRGTGWRRLVAPLVRHWSSVVGILVGLSSLAAAVAVLVLSSGLDEVARTILLLGASVAALVLAVLPWIIRVRQTLAEARQEAMLADARADMAAHLHDSVLQTLALIQRQAGDPKKVTALARRQERELRQWLYGDAPTGGSLVEALTAELLDVEDTHGVDVELVSVGDTELTPELAAVVRASREAMVNAAKHSGAERVDVFAEADEDLVSVFIRDRGKGFDLAEIDDDRMGVRASIVERVKRAGGRAIIRTAPGEGTEVRLELPR
ncbi:phage shock protein C (PspC) family protein [Propionicimonas paludicola]|uniref:Phage shock protein C (PspC) family protein n=1 Tax=Propionicimonas paludicola TaxID=185243 RepID=A0A2A9CP03_9ACTN|nr:ATP-binding protein [Propionicimonas paludicola]PFG15815.1 phage shock protein C (PspC) family protein [Propionicimonas paludicola]